MSDAVRDCDICWLKSKVKELEQENKRLKEQLTAKGVHFDWINKEHGFDKHE